MKNGLVFDVNNLSQVCSCQSGTSLLCGWDLCRPLGLKIQDWTCCRRNVQVTPFLIHQEDPFRNEKNETCTFHFLPRLQNVVKLNIFCTNNFAVTLPQLLIIWHFYIQLCFYLLELNFVLHLTLKINSSRQRCCVRIIKIHLTFYDFS